MQTQGFDKYKKIFLRFVFLFKDTVIMAVHERGFKHASHRSTSFSVTSVTVALINKCQQFKRQSLSSPLQQLPEARTRAFTGNNWENSLHLKALYAADEEFGQ